jgi:hypothetical protein
MTKKSNRRKFLQKAAKAVAPFGTIQDKASGDQEKVKLLTADGEVIEIEQRLFDQLTQSTASTKKTTNADILKWTNQIKIKPETDE